MGKAAWLAALLLGTTCAAFAQKTTPHNETRHPAAIRSTHSQGADLLVPLCPVHFHDSLGTDGIAGAHQAGVTPPKPIHELPARITQDAIRTAGVSHVGNYHVILDAVIDPQGKPTQLCLEKSAGYGLDGSAAAAVRQYRFNPAKKDGKAVAMRMPIDVPFVTPNPPPAPGSTAPAR